jgi:F-type H+-transporting ATPase subunit b
MEQVLATLGINGRDFLLHTINFVVLIFLLRKVLYRPVITMLDERQRRIRESIERAERVRLEAERADQEREGQLAETRRQVREMLDQATQTAERIQADARDKAEQQARAIVERAQQEAASERAQAMADLRREVGTLAVLAAERVIGRNLDDQSQRKLVEEFLAEQPSDGHPGGNGRPAAGAGPALDTRA